MSESPPPADAHVVIAVVRSGGIAGIRRRWQIEAEAPASEDWIALIERCPWDEGAGAGAGTDTGADRFVWSIRARTPAERRECELPDSALAGPWRALVDAVRAAQRGESDDP